MAKSKKSGSRRRSWAGHVAAWRRSGLTRSAYAREYGFHPETFSRWVRLLGYGEKSASHVTANSGRVESPIQFVGVSEDLIARAASPVTARRSPGISIVIAQRFRVTVPEGFSPLTLADVVKTLESLG